MRLGSDCELNGNLVVAGNVVFAGRLHGHIRATGNVDVAATARIGGSVRGHDVRLAGLVEGDVISAGVLTLERSGRVLGEIFADSICIEPGASLDGRVHLGGTAAARGEAAFTASTNLDASSSTVRVHRCPVEPESVAREVPVPAAPPNEVAEMLAAVDAINADDPSPGGQTAPPALMSAGLSSPVMSEFANPTRRKSGSAGFAVRSTHSANSHPAPLGTASATSNIGSNHDSTGSGALLSPVVRLRSRGEEALRRRLAAFEERLRRPDTIAVIGAGPRNRDGGSALRLCGAEAAVTVRDQRHSRMMQHQHDRDAAGAIAV